MESGRSVRKYVADASRYSTMKYNRCGRSGLKLPAVSLGLWHNFGSGDNLQNSRKMLQRAFDLGITHFDLANNYGPPAGSAEETLGKILKKDFQPYRDELVISTKAGYYMCPGPYGEWGSRKYLLSSLDQSLKRMGIDYVDIFYSHRPDGDTPFEETMSALEQAVRQGKAIYAGISSYNSTQTKLASKILKSLGVPCLIHQPRYNMFDRHVEDDRLLDTLDAEGIGCIVFSPLNQGILTDKYFKGVPKGSRASINQFLKKENITEDSITKAFKLNEIAKSRGQTLAQMALAWVLRRGTVTSALIGASSVKQIEDCAACTVNLDFDPCELKRIDLILKK